VQRSRLEASPEELALRAQRGSMPAFAELVDRFEARLFNFLLRRVASAADAEDLTQEAFLRAWQRIDTYRSKWRFSTWLFTIGLRLAVSQGRKRAALAPAERLRDEPVMPPQDLHIALEHAEERSSIWAMVGRALGPEQQSALWLRYVEGMAVKDIAAVLGRTQVSVRVMLFRARAVLAQKLTPDGQVHELKPASESQRGVPC
jgi:RNA polymerase sigma-70 factor (ECF subfamily)